MSRNFENKREQFINPKKSKTPYIIIAAILFTIAIPLVLTVFNSRKEAKGYFGEPVLSPRSYIGQFVSMTAVEPMIEENYIKIPLNFVDQNNIVFFEAVNNAGQQVPMMAYVTPTGRIFAGSSMCEPCRGRTFSLAGETLFCDTCRTTYTIEEHTFISGAPACGSFPPVNMNPVIEDGFIIIDINEVLNWRIRV